MALPKAHPSHTPMADPTTPVGESRWASPACLLLVISAALAAYHNSLSGPFVFDDIPAIVDNPSIRHLWPITRVMVPPLSTAGAAGRPIVNLPSQSTTPWAEPASRDITSSISCFM